MVYKLIAVVILVLLGLFVSFFMYYTGISSVYYVLCVGLIFTCSF